MHKDTTWCADVPPGIHFSSTLRSQFRPPKSASALKAMKRTLPGKCRCTNDIKRHSDSNLQKVKLTHATCILDKSWKNNMKTRWALHISDSPTPTKGSSPMTVCAARVCNLWSFSASPFEILSRCKRTCRVQSAACAEKHPAGQSLRKNATQPCAPGIQLLAANSVRLQKDLQSAKRCIRWKAPKGPKFEEKCHAALCAWHSALGSKFCQVAKGLAECKALHALKSTLRAKVWGKMPRSPARLAFSSWQQILSGCKRTCRVQSAAYAEKHPAGQSLRKNATQPCAPGIQLLAANSIRLQKDLQSAKRCMRWKTPCGPKFEEKRHTTLWAWHSALGSFSSKPFWPQISEGWKCL